MHCCVELKVPCVWFCLLPSRRTTRNCSVPEKTASFGNQDCCVSRETFGPLVINGHWQSRAAPACFQKDTPGQTAEAVRNDSRPRLERVRVRAVKALSGSLSPPRPARIPRRNGRRTSLDARIQSRKKTSIEQRKSGDFMGVAIIQEEAPRIRPITCGRQSKGGPRWGPPSGNRHSANCLCPG